MWEGPAALQLATDLSGIEGLTSVALYKAEGGDFSCSVRAEFADVLGEKTTSFEAIDEKFTQVKEQFTQVMEKFTQVREKFTKVMDGFDAMDEKFT
jgi:hypothetical protein